MNGALSEFASDARRLSRNPLGIIALFLALIYGIAGVVTPKLPSQNSQLLLIMVCFLVTFPVLVLGSFTYLVARHHSKLYAPSDFNDERNFMRSIEAGLARSSRFVDLERVTERIRSELDNLPLFVFARLPVRAQGLLKQIYLSSRGEHGSTPTETERIETIDAEVLAQKTGWIERRAGKWVLSLKGEREVPQFIEIVIPRLL